MLYDLITYLPMFITLFWVMILLTTREKQRKAKVIFALFMIVAFIMYLSHAIYFQGIEEAYLYIDPVYTFMTLAIYPLYFWYIQQLTTDKEYNFKHLYLLLPALILSLLTALIYILMEDGERSQYIHQFLFGHGTIDDPSFLIQAQTYTYRLTRIISVILILYVFFRGRPTVVRYNKKLAEYYSNLTNKSIHWVNRILNASIVIYLLSIGLHIIGRPFFFGSPKLLLIPSLIFSIILFSIGYLGHYQKFDISNLDMPDLEENKSHRTLNKNVEQLLEKFIEQFDKNKIYHQNELKITDLASSLNTNRTYISNLINQYFECSFNEYVNRYRITEAKELINTSPEKSLEDIAVSVGYNSLSTFSRTFKQQEDIAPSHYRTLLKRKNKNPLIPSIQNHI